MTESIDVLVVDDDPWVRNAYQTTLVPEADSQLAEVGAKLFGEPQKKTALPFRYRLTLAQNGAEGLAAVRRAVKAKQHFAMAFVDLNMPGMNGVEAVRKIWAAAPDIKIVIVTGFGEQTPEDIAASAKRSDLYYLRKPVHPEEIRQFARVLAEQWLLEKEREILRKMLPICSFCKKIRNDRDYWESVDNYIAAHSSIRFTHSVCPNCVKKHYPELATR